MNGMVMAMTEGRLKVDTVEKVAVKICRKGIRNNRPGG